MLHWNVSNILKTAGWRDWNAGQTIETPQRELVDSDQFSKENDPRSLSNGDVMAYEF